MPKKCALLIISMLFMLSAAAEIVAVSFPCYDLTRAVTGDLQSVTMLIKPGQEVHAFDPSPSDAARVLGADLVVCIGGESDEWLETLLSSADELPPVLKLIDSVVPLKELDPEEDAWDEHIWTSPKNAILMLDSLETELCARFPDDAEAFRENAAAYRVELEQLDADLTELIAASDDPKVVFADRFPFLYLASAYGLDYDAAFFSCTADCEPSAKKMMSLIDEINSESIPVIYTLELSTQNIARTISEATGAEILQFHSIQTVTADEFAAGETYVSLMRANLEALAKGIGTHAR